MTEEDPCENCADKLSWYCYTCCPITVYRGDCLEDGEKDGSLDQVSSAKKSDEEGSGQK